MTKQNLIEMAWDCAIIKPHFRDALVEIVKAAKVDSKKHLVAEISYRQIGKAVGLTPAGAKSRVKRLLSTGVIVMKKRSKGRGANIYAITKKLMSKGGEL